MHTVGYITSEALSSKSGSFSHSKLLSLSLSVSLSLSHPPLISPLDTASIKAPAKKTSGIDDIFSMGLKAKKVKLEVSHAASPAECVEVRVLK